MAIGFCIFYESVLVLVFFSCSQEFFNGCVYFLNAIVVDSVVNLFAFTLCLHKIRQTKNAQVLRRDRLLEVKVVIDFINIDALVFVNKI